MDEAFFIQSRRNMKVLTKGILFSILGLLVLAGAYFAGVSCAQKPRPSPGFLQSTSAQIRLGVLDKFDIDNTDKGTFIVTGPDGKLYQTYRQQSLDNGVYVLFPEDFSYPVDSSSYNLYSWKCVVGDKTVAEGKFKWGNGQADDDNRNLK
jgi:hypothetical protein